jgi:hypothetical protein
MKYIIYLFSLLVTANCQALISWPAGPAPCNGTLQACVDGVSEGEVIQLNTNNTIFETITASKQISLVAGTGYRPIFGNGHGIEITGNTSVNRTVRFEGLTLLNGRIAYHHFSSSTAAATLMIRNNQILANSVETEAIRVINSSDQELTLNIDYNHINYLRFTSSTLPRGAINIRNGFEAGTTFSTVSGRVYGNTISAQGAASVGIGVFSYTSTTIDLIIAGNEITGGADGGVFIERPNGSGVSTLNIGNNAFYQQADQELSKGVYLNGLSGTIDADIVNNTMVGIYDGLFFRETAGATVDVYLYNNLITRGGTPVDTDTGTNITNDYNLFYLNDFVDTDFVPGANHLTANPLIKGQYNGRLKAGSPAIEAGEGLAVLALGATPAVDADGTQRFKKGDDTPGAQLVDIGAYEFGDLLFSHDVASAGSHISPLNHPLLNGDPAIDGLHITSNYSPPGETGVYNNDNEGVYYELGNWWVFNQSTVNLSPGASFNVQHYANTSNTIEHTSDEAASISTIVDHFSLNNQPDRILQVTQHWTGVYNPHPFGVFYFGSSWVISNFDGANMPVGSTFNIHSQPASKSAFLHRVTPANSSGGHITYVRHPLLDNVECAEIQVTQSAEEGVFNDAPIGVWYAGNTWTIYNQDISEMPENSAFFVSFDPAQIADCTDLIFADSYD